MGGGMNRRERRKAAAKGKVNTALQTGERDCISCGTTWTTDLLPAYYVTIRQGRKPTEQAVGMSCHVCAATLGPKGVSRYIDPKAEHLAIFEHKQGDRPQ